MKNENVEMRDAVKKDVILAFRPEAVIQEAFKIIEPSGKTYRVYANGGIEGFLPGSTIVNYIPGYAWEYHSSMCRALSCPTNSPVLAAGGAEHGFASKAANCVEKIIAAPAEK